MKCCPAFKEVWAEADSNPPCSPAQLTLCGKVMGNPVLSSSDSSRSSHVPRSSHSCCDPKSRQLQWGLGPAASPPGAGAGNGAALQDGGRRACASPAHLCFWKGVIVKLYQELVVAEVLQKWRCVVILNVPAQCSCEVVALAVASSGCSFQRNPSDLGVWAFRKGIKKTHENLSPVSV